MIATMLFGRSQLDQVGALVMEVTLDQTFEMQNDVTQNPVEYGLPTSDFIKPMPDVITMHGLASTAPLNEGILGQQYQYDEANNILRRIADDRILSLIRFGTGEIVQSAFDELVKLKESGELVTVVTALKTYTDMAVRSVTVPRRPQNGDAIEYTIECVKVRRVSSAIVDLATGIASGKTSPSVGTRAEGKKKLGLQQNEDAGGLPSILAGLLGL